MTIRKNWRSHKASALVTDFKQFIPNSHVVKGRDDRFLSQVMRDYGLDGIDVLYAMELYRHETYPRDVPAFVRWIRQNVSMFDGTRLEREATVAEMVSGTRIPRSCWAAFDDLDIPSAGFEYTRERARQSLGKYVEEILGADKSANR